jgi:hypothetical protein
MFDTKSGNSIKVIDWGTSRKFDPTHRMKRLVGTVKSLLISLTPLAILPRPRGP